MLKRIVDILTSLRLTVACLALAVVLVFIGTLAQVKVGLYDAQRDYFRSLLIWWGPAGASWKIPVLPGGYLLGGVVLVNLLAAHAKRFTLSRKKIGIFVTHAGLILLLLGQLFSELFQIESYMRMEEGETHNYSESQLKHELVFIDKSDPKQDRVISIPEAIALQKGEINDPALPFKVKVKDYYINSSPMLRAPTNNAPVLHATDGTGQRVWIEENPKATAMDDADLPSATIELADAKGTLGTWLVSHWFSDRVLISNVSKKFGPQWAKLVGPPQEFTADGKTWQVALRSKRYYKPYAFTMRKFHHDLYLGTDKPKNFASEITLVNPLTKEERDVNISMNNPLRYGGETYFQGSFDPNNARVTILQVVRNPVWLTPYIACAMVGGGLLIQFLMHLFEFIKKRGNSSSGGNRSTAETKGSKKQRAKAARAAEEVATARLSTLKPRSNP